MALLRIHLGGIITTMNRTIKKDTQTENVVTTFRMAPSQLQALSTQPTC